MVCAYCNRPVPPDSIVCFACGALQEDAHDEVVISFVEDLVERGNSAYREKRYAQAIAELEKVLKLQPDDEEIRDTVDTLKEEYRNIREKLERANALLAQHQYEEAKSEALQILDAAPGYREAEKVVARAAHSINEFEEAVSRGKKHLDERRFEEAIEEFNIAMAIDHRASEVARLKKSAEGSLSVWQGEVEQIKKLTQEHAFEEAITLAETMLQRRPFDEKLANLLSELKSTVQTLKSSRAAGKKALRERRWGEAQGAWNRVLSILPEDTHARENRDRALIEIARARAARKRRLIKFGAAAGVILVVLILLAIGLANRSHFNWGEEYLRLGEPLRALEEFKKTGTFMVGADRLEQKVREATYLAYLYKGDRARAKKDWAKAKTEYGKAHEVAADPTQTGKLIELVEFMEKLEATRELARDQKYGEAIDAARVIADEAAASENLPEADSVKTRSLEAIKSYRLMWLTQARNLLAAEKLYAGGSELRKIVGKCPGDRDTTMLLKQCRETWLEHIKYLREEGKWDQALMEYQRMGVPFPEDENINLEFRGTQAQRKIGKIRALIKQEKYVAALQAAHEVQPITVGIPQLEEEIAGLLDEINAAIDSRYGELMTQAREMLGVNKLEKARTLLEQALTFRGTEEARTALREVDDRLATPEAMVYVPAGSCIVGDSGQALWKEEGPAHEVELAAYYVDERPVTNAQYMDFVKATRHKMPTHWVEAGKRIPPGKEKHPVTHVDLSDARSFAQWANKRLPTEYEWEKAARGPNGFIYPWGSKYVTGMANDQEAAREGTSPVGAFLDGKSYYGCLDMAGNVWEWTSTKLYLYPGNSEKLDPDEEKLYVLKGGCFVDDRLYLRCSFRETVDPDSSYAFRATLGFRCAADVRR